MDQLDTATFNGLSNLLNSLLPAPAPPLVGTSLSVLPVRFSSPGLGNYIGPSEDPFGSIYGRRLKAQILLTITADEAANLNTVVASVTQALLAADHNTVRQKGLLSLALDSLGQQQVNEPGAADNTVRREITLNALYEFIQLPTTTEGIIGQIPINLTVSAAPIITEQVQPQIKGKDIPVTEKVKN